MLISKFISLATLFGVLPTTLAQNFSNPIIWEDLPDNEVIRVKDTFYMTASSFHYSPGAPLFRSQDLVNWEAIGHSVPSLDWGAQYNLSGDGTAYVAGLWASTLQYRESDDRWYFLACVGFSKTYIYVAEDPVGTWTRHATIDQCYYDAGLLFDADGSVYVAYGNTGIRVAQLSHDLRSEIKQDLVYNTPSDIGALEGARMYRKDGNYYIFLTRPPNAQYMLKSSSPWGPYEIKVLVDRIPLSGIPNAGAPHQGSLVDTPNGDWYYMGFTDIYPGGRAPVLAPITWGDDGFPALVTVNGEWGDYPYPVTPVDAPDTLGLDQFLGTELKPQWEWNHNPDAQGFTVNNGLTLHTVTVTDDIYLARNTLAHRIRGPVGTATVHIDFSSMADGDRAGFAALRDDSGWVGVERNGDSWSLVACTQNMNDGWTAGLDKVTLFSQTDISFREVRFRIKADIRPGAEGSAIFSYSTNGADYTEVGSFKLNPVWEFFPGYRYGIFNYATKALGGSIKVLSFYNEA